MANTAGRMTGGCQCGAVRYEVASAPLEIYVCHCTECRRQSASAFGISVYVPSDSVRLKQGEPKRWSRPAAIAGMLDCHFCVDCGTRLWHISRGEAEVTSIKGGTLDHGIDISSAVHVWTRHKLPGVIVPPSAKQFSEEPDD
jgi:hypothetical protein